MSKERYENLRASNVYLKGRIKDASLLLSLKLNSEARRNFNYSYNSMLNTNITISYYTSPIAIRNVKTYALTLS